MSDALCATCLHEKAEHGPLGDCFKQRPEGIHGPMCCQCVGYRTFDGFAANLRAQLAQAQERVKVVEGLEKDLTSQYEITCADCEHYNHSGQCQTCYCTSEKKAAIVPLDELAQRDAEIARLVEDQQWLDPGAWELIKAFGTFSIERLPDWNFAVAINGNVYGIGMTVFDAISSAAAQIDKIKASIKELEEGK